MITSVNHSATAGRADSALTPLVDRLSKRGDVNRPGPSGSAEFSGLLIDLVRSLDAEAKAHGTGVAPEEAAAQSADVSPPVPAAADQVVSALARRAAARYDEAARIKER